jgi:hypothetical protein
VAGAAQARERGRVGARRRAHTVSRYVDHPSILCKIKSALPMQRARGYRFSVPVTCACRHPMR